MSYVHRFRWVQYVLRSIIINLVVIQNEGKVIKGKARSGAKLRSNDLPLDSLEGYFTYKVLGVEIGKAAFGSGYVVAAILDWAEVCN